MMLCRSTLFTILFLAAHLFAAEQKVVSIPSLVMKKSFPAIVVVPGTYSKSTLRYPVIYLLHMFGGTSAIWPAVADLSELSEKYQILFVCPTGENSWYVDSPLKKKSRFETYITGEIIDYIDAHYRTWPQADGRAVIGISMGGHGALTMLARHPGLFCGGGSISGVLDITEFPHEWELAKVLGPYKKNKLRWQQYSFIGQFHLLAGKNKAIILDCGTSDFALAGNRKAHALLLNAKIPHEYHERKGGHTRVYAAKVIEFHVAYMEKRLKKAE